MSRRFCCPLGRIMLSEHGLIRATGRPPRPLGSGDRAVGRALDTLLLAPALQSHFDNPLYGTDLRRERTAANDDLLPHGMFRTPADGTS
jgi:hypothetical protein